MDHGAHIGLVDTHAESIGGHHHSHRAVFPAVLAVVLLLSRQTGMVVFG